VRAPCVAHLDTAKELLEFGVMNEGAQALVDEDWRNCSCTVEDTWRAAAEPALPEAKPRPGGSDPR
jgi:hypothetical protein